ncbi:MAG: glucose-6-phosphate isomerase [Bacteroidales bacterium]|jgi:glucose-6-phosphate isomerase|nr:glucose-6-phosphate isomerase [Bacteroidales bacterium]
MNIDFKKSNLNDKGFDSVYENLSSLLPYVHNLLVNKKGKGNNFLGWIDLPLHIQKLLKDINETATYIQKKCEILVVIGIGGSYLGTKAVIESLSHHFNSLQNYRKYPLILFAGQTMSEDYISDLLEILNEKEYALAVISKSGTTTEPAIAFRILKNHIESKYGKAEAKNRIVTITDKEKGALKTLSVQEGYKTYVVPDDVGGRYSVLTSVGLLPIAVAGIDIVKLVNGACLMRNDVLQENENNIAWKYAAIRNALLQNGKSIELMVNYSPSLNSFSEWWKQLYGESEGKNGKGLFPAAVSNTTDLHSLGQYIQDGARLMFETTLHVEMSKSNISIPYDKENTDDLNYLCEKTLTYINHQAEKGTQVAHLSGDVPQITISIEKLDEENIGKLIYFFEFACGLSGYLLGINPFDQPGVEAYKKNMFRLLGKD